MSAGVFYSAEEEETEQNKRGEEGKQMKLYPQSRLMVKHSDELSNEEQWQKIKGKGEKRLDKVQLTILAEIKVNTEEQRRPVLSREERIDFYPQWSLQQGVREEKEG